MKSNARPLRDFLVGKTLENRHIISSRLPSHYINMVLTDIAALAFVLTLWLPLNFSPKVREPVAQLQMSLFQKRGEKCCVIDSFFPQRNIGHVLMIVP